ncbi:ISL3 family transposase [Cuniculiplasma sp. SKW3]|uniref:ISL3 family transposase n=1 Tax=unclassified Cuniculiplasma TaxID=2619706 RepID=UPI003FD3CDC8
MTRNHKKGHKYMTLVYDMMNNGVEYISYDRKKKSLDQYYNTLSKEQLSSISTVSMDIWDTFISSTLEHVPDAGGKIVFDRFHVMKHVNMAVDSNCKIEICMFLEKGMDDIKGIG